MKIMMSLHLHTRTHTHTDALSFSSLAFVNYFCTCRWTCIGVAKRSLHIDVSTYFHTCTHTLSLSPLHSHSQTHTYVSIYRYTNLFKYTHIATHLSVARTFLANTQCWTTRGTNTQCSTAHLVGEGTCEVSAPVVNKHHYPLAHLQGGQQKQSSKTRAVSVRWKRGDRVQKCAGTRGASRLKVL